MQPKFNLWIEKDGRVVLSAWRVELLETIESTGSITGAAEKLNIPYRRAWEKVKEIEDGLGLKVVETATGGKKGGGARLTHAGRRAIQQFHRFSTGFDQQVVKRFRDAFGR